MMRREFITPARRRGGGVAARGARTRTHAARRRTLEPGPGDAEMRSRTEVFAEGLRERGLRWVETCRSTTAGAMETPTSSRPRRRTNCARARRGPRHLRCLDHAAPVGQPPGPDRICADDRPSWPRCRRKLVPTGRQHHRLYSVRVQHSAEMVGVAQGDRAGHHPCCRPARPLRPAGIGTVGRLAIGGIGIRDPVDGGHRS